MGPIRAGLRRTGGIRCASSDRNRPGRRPGQILAVPGIDAVFVGPNDLAVSAGLDSSYEGRHPEHRRLIEAIAGAARANGVAAGIMCGTAEVARQWHEIGFVMLALQGDTRLLVAASEELVANARRLTASRSRAPER
jgi:4-hydroxy-2-oxoheptanedioate aldolase